MPDGLPERFVPDFECSLAYMEPGRTLEYGDSQRIYSYKSVTKVFAAWAMLVAVDRGLVTLDDEVEVGRPEPRTVTLRHLLAHASGLAFDSDELSFGVQERRVYSNRGIEVAARHVEQATATPFNDWMENNVLQPLGLVETMVDGSPAYAGEGSIRDLEVFAGELLRPTLISTDLAEEATSVVFPGLRGITPGFGAYSDNTWGLGVEIKGQKARTWFPRAASPRTFGHFGQSGSLIWVDPEGGRALAFLGDAPFGQWHKEHWQALGDYFLHTF